MTCEDEELVDLGNGTVWMGGREGDHPLTLNYLSVRMGEEERVDLGNETMWEGGRQGGREAGGPSSYP